MAIQVFGNLLASSRQARRYRRYGQAQKISSFANRPLLYITEKENNPAYGLENVGGPGCQLPEFGLCVAFVRIVRTVRQFVSHQLAFVLRALIEGGFAGASAA
jgi:hypothetical protein